MFVVGPVWVNVPAPEFVLPSTASILLTIVREIRSKSGVPR